MKKTIILFVTSIMMFNFISCEKDVTPPVALFSYSGDTIVPSAIDFINESTGASSYLWDFGDGITSTEENPSHIYTEVGTFTVKLTVNNDGGTDEFVNTINIIAVTPISSFSAISDTETPLKVLFTNTTTIATSYDWDFGDGQSSTEKNPTHTYAAPGIYTVTLTSDNDGQIHSITQTVTLPTAQFSFSGVGVQVPCNVAFTNTSINATSYLWDFGDGTTSTSENPTHTYTTGGNFNVKLTTKTTAGFNTVTQQITTLASPSNCIIGSTRTLTSFSDNGTYPNLGLRITKSGTVVRNASTIWLGISAYDLPLDFDSETSLSINSSNWNDIYHIEVASYDDYGVFQSVLGYVEFKPSDYATLTNHYPSEVTLKNGDNQIVLNLSWTN